MSVKEMDLSIATRAFCSLLLVRASIVIAPPEPGKRMTSGILS
jgi:hypothetical protein